MKKSKSRKDKESPFAGVGRMCRPCWDVGPARRGNTLVLVAAILVLLVIIASAYLTRTQAQRITSTAVQGAQQRDDNVKVLADWIAQEASDALFVWRVDDAVYSWGAIADANVPRLPPPRDATRYGIDWNFPYNFAPYHTVPVTNWPDPPAF
jgi:hypothetical protein